MGDRGVWGGEEVFLPRFVATCRRVYLLGEHRDDVFSQMVDNKNTALGRKSDGIHRMRGARSVVGVSESCDRSRVAWKVVQWAAQTDYRGVSRRGMRPVY